MCNSVLSLNASFSCQWASIMLLMNCCVQCYDKPTVSHSICIACCMDSVVSLSQWSSWFVVVARTTQAIKSLASEQKKTNMSFRISMARTRGHRDERKCRLLRSERRLLRHSTMQPESGWVTWLDGEARRDGSVGAAAVYGCWFTAASRRAVTTPQQTILQATTCCQSVWRNRLTHTHCPLATHERICALILTRLRIHKSFTCLLTYSIYDVCVLKRKKFRKTSGTTLYDNRITGLNAQKRYLMHSALKSYKKTFVLLKTIMWKEEKRKSFWYSRFNLLSGLLNYL